MSDKATSDNILVKNARLAVEIELKKKRALNQPIARFDKKTGEVYLENSDGTKTSFGYAMQKGRYSERYNSKT